MCRYTVRQKTTHEGYDTYTQAILSSKEAILLGDIVTRPKLGIIYQSFNCHERIPRDEPRWAYEKSTLNGDGFGVGWYPCKEMAHLLGENKNPCVFTSLKPAWGDRNLRQIAEKTASPLIFAHVRAAGPGSGPPTEANCHPFVYGRFLFMHNGAIGDWRNMRRELLSNLKTSHAFDFAMENNPIDSVLLFALVIDQLDPKRDEYSINELRSFMEKMISTICVAADKLRVEDVNYLNCCMSDGNNIVASRFVLGPYSQRVVEKNPPKPTSLPNALAEEGPIAGEDSDADDSESSLNSVTDPGDFHTISTGNEVHNGRLIQRRPDRSQSLSLYFATGTRWVRDGQNDFKMVHKDKRNHVCIVTSEPLTEVREEWVPVPHNHLIVVTSRCDVLLQPLTPCLLWPDVAASAFERSLDILSVAPIRKRSTLANAEVFTNYSRYTPSNSTRRPGRWSIMDDRPSFVECKPAAISRSLQSLEGRQIEELMAPTTPDTQQPTTDAWALHAPIPKTIASRRILTRGQSTVLCMTEMTLAGNAYIFAGDEAGGISMWSLDFADRLTYWPAHKGSVLALQPYQYPDEPRDMWLFSASSDTTVALWNIDHLHQARCRPDGSKSQVSYDASHIIKDFFTIRLRFEPIQGDVLSLAIQSCLANPDPEDTATHDDFLFMGYQSTLIGYLRLQGLFKVVRECRHLQQLKAGFDPGHIACNCQIADHVQRDQDGNIEIVLSPNSRAAGNQLRRLRESAIIASPCVMANATAVALGMPMQKEPYVFGIPAAHKDQESTAVSEGALSSPSNSDASDSTTCCQASLDWAIMTPSQSALQHHCGFIECLDISGEYLLSGGGDGLVLVWKNRKHVTTLSGHTGGVLCLVCDANVTYSGSRDRTIRVWDMRSFSCRQVLRGHSTDVMTLTMTASILLSGSTTNEIFGWSRKWNEILFVLRMDPDLSRPSEGRVFLTDLIRLKDEKTALSSGGDGVVGVWDISSFQASGESSSPQSARGGLQSPLLLSEADVHVFRPGTDNETPIKLCSTGETALRKVTLLLESLIPLKSLSGLKMYLPECWRTAQFIVTCLQDIGAETRLSPTTNSTAPVVSGRCGSDPDKPTVILYSHYDVVPPGGDMEFHWSTHPWSLTSINGYLSGRGVTDNKGPLAMQLVAVSELLAGKYDREQYIRGLQMEDIESKVPDACPVNVVFIYEGEEESGSTGFDGFLKSNSELFEDASYAIFTNSYWLDDERPCLVHGMRGVIDMQITISGSAEPLGLHSGIHGGAVAEPLADLVGILGGILNPDGHVTVPGFYDSVLDADISNVKSPGMSPMTEYKSACSSATAFDLFDLSKYQRETQNAGLRKVAPRKLLQKRWLEPVLSITEIYNSAQQSTDQIGANFRILPSVVSCNISVRLVPDQNAKDVVAKLESYFQDKFKQRHSPNSLNITVLRTHDWWQGDTSSPLFMSAARAIEHVWAVEPLCIREGGTMPVIRQLQDSLGVTTIQIPFGQASDNAHLPNERLKAVNVAKGVEVLKMTLFGIGQIVCSDGSLAPTDTRSAWGQ
eukprot:Blabericola_migrator_1__8994@NODE_478_length_8196_cov_107_510026_g372_i0_p1_GENE_NODE_478_length_8196_cov_107_510026_g372_i0NODE_478_length_8196_cov_107_510026_g372_i0_p1_ORF_typecomplete_len1542_score239_03GATase_4/PF13230_6/4_4e41GATase_4/PF13230_6/1_8e03Peptidase_M20/PF01546_28/1_6e34WD40/PF00400_32/0_54WD40/PF00400_32/0_12WD40/PF00400_32/4e07WD40/PF00400_32/2_8M20_dimer/PF07687_14/1_5e13GATase_6/PF13522_6/8_1e12WD40_like/PF17005_5/4_2e02WD40_like/PF17005_5/8e09ANAPC4_WD40/PF12894_7/7_2ANAPC4